MSTLISFTMHVRLAALLIVLLVTGFGCGPSEWGLHIRHLEDETKRQNQAAAIQAALAPFFSSEQALTNSLPGVITSLPIFSDDPAHIMVSRTDCADSLMLYIGGGFGSWGLLVVRPGHDREICDWHRARTKRWDDGVYFFSEYKD